MGIRVEIFELDENQLELGDAANDWIEDRVFDLEERNGRRHRSARRAVEKMLEKRRLREQLSDFLP